MSKSLGIAQLGSEIIRSKASVVTDIKSKKVQDFIDDLLYTCKEQKGMGIAATQVYETKAIFIVSSNPNERYPNAPVMEPEVIINPKIVSHSNEISKEWEGCLSLPGIRALVPRYQSIEVSYTNRLGETINTKYDGFLARIFQHEFDHLNGTVFIDRVDTTRDVVMEVEYQKIIKQETT